MERKITIKLPANKVRTIERAVMYFAAHFEEDSMESLERGDTAQAEESEEIGIELKALFRELVLQRNSQ